MAIGVWCMTYSEIVSFHLKVYLGETTLEINSNKLLKLLLHNTLPTSFYIATKMRQTVDPLNDK